MDPVDLVAGFTGGVAVVLAGHPFDTTKIRLQTAPRGYYRDSLDCVRQTLTEEGLQGFYSGIVSPLFGQMFFRACYFSTYFAMRKKFKEWDLMDRERESGGLGDKHGQGQGQHKLSLTQLALCGAVTGFSISFIESPIDMIKTKMQVQVFQKKLDPLHKISYNSVLECVRYHIRSYGIRSLWQGLSGTLIRNIPGNAALFTTNDAVKRTFYGGDSKTHLDIRINLLAGGLSGLAYWVGTYPLDVIKSKMQSVDGDHRMSWLSTARHIVKTGGWKAFGHGFAPCAIRSVPACSLMFTTVDVVRDYLKRHGW